MSTKTQMEEITPTEVSQRINEGKRDSIIDVREHDEIAEGAIPGIHHIPLGELEDRLSEIDKSKEHILVCRSSARSGRAAEFLKSKGYKVKNMAGGMLDWKGELERK
ncbi:rhodanese-like domain-containing protein [Halalkalibacter akibai]|uniref:Rhodanese-like domain protein n=1 Tax=Halalkalibacter akibai (strain ATCC 43226 / DSM 21942 / CIP 109018 / JCM 9157 / 1139) TaxID=1236973 RepID=W4QP87_HALA3|nr:rhodanese-like domain-containing protein [Halalkalibacter akibai]GAE33164.1 rhodanese-like domain protein [Halalkalibacter akibai JCM 9157]